MSTLNDLRQSVIEGNVAASQGLTIQSLAEHSAPDRILNDGLISAMAEVGRLFQCGEFYVPEMLVSARAMKGALELLRPQLVAAHVEPIGKVVIGTVQGDLHDIGKNLVAVMLEGAGLQVIDLGTDVSPAKFVEAVKQHQPDLVGCSALLTTTMPRMKDIIEALVQAGLRENVHIMIGGAPVTVQYAAAIGADLFAPDASSAATLARSLLKAALTYG